MQSNSIVFVPLSTDSDRYTLSFSQTVQSHQQVYAILTEAIFYRMSEVIDENELTVLGLTLKLDCFEFGRMTQGYIEMDYLFHSESVTSLDVYLYDQANELKAKASCTLQYENTSRIPVL